MTKVNDNLLGRFKTSARPSKLKPTERLVLNRGTKVCKEKRRPFTYRDDFRDINYGTFRNIVSRLRKLGLIESFRSGPAFYWTKGVRKPINRMGAGERYDDFITLLSSVPLEERCIHDVHIYFRANGIYEFIKLVGNVMKIASYSKDIILEDIDIGLHRVARVAVHLNDSVSLTIGCSTNPFPLTSKGWVDFVSTLGVLRERLTGLCNGHVRIPSVVSWLMKTWHIGRDSSVEVSGRKFDVTISQATSVVRAYLKKVEGRSRLRIEKVEQEAIDVASLMMDRLMGEDDRNEQF